jgi:hypothetical protein
MILRIVILGALGYAGYTYLSRERTAKLDPVPAPDVRIAGGPLSKEAFLIHADDELLRP